MRGERLEVGDLGRGEDENTLRSVVGRLGDTGASEFEGKAVLKPGFSDHHDVWLVLIESADEVSQLLLLVD